MFVRIRFVCMAIGWMRVCLLRGFGWGWRGLGWWLKRFDGVFLAEAGIMSGLSSSFGEGWNSVTLLFDFLGWCKSFRCFAAGNFLLDDKKSPKIVFLFA